MKALKKTTAFAVALGIMVTGISSFADEAIKVFVDGSQLDFDVNPIIENDRTLVPLRAIFEALGAEVTWEQETRTASATLGDDTVSITIDNNTLYKNNTAIELDVPARIINDRTLVPVRAVSESFDSEVLWDGDTKSVIITTPQTTPEPIAEPTAKPTAEPQSASDEISFEKLSDEDLKLLIDKKDVIRYNFEQMSLPQFVLQNSTIYDDMQDGDAFGKAVFDQWTRTGAKYIIRIQADSETTYSVNIDEPTEEALLKVYDKILKDAGFDKKAMFEDIKAVKSKNGTMVAILTFKSADSMVECKYIGIAASKDKAPRYFTAENDIMEQDLWFFCEVYEDGRGTHGTFKKTNSEKDLEKFADIAIQTYEEDK